MSIFNKIFSRKSEDFDIDKIDTKEDFESSNEEYFDYISEEYNKEYIDLEENIDLSNNRYYQYFMNEINVLNKKFKDNKIININSSIVSENINISDMEKYIIKLIEIEELFLEENNSLSFNNALSILNKIRKFEPLTPIDKSDEEDWILIDNYNQDENIEKIKYYTHNRYEYLIREYYPQFDEFLYYDIRGILYYNDNTKYTDTNSKIDIYDKDFPYIPKIRYFKKYYKKQKWKMIKQCFIDLYNLIFKNMKEVKESELK